MNMACGWLVDKIGLLGYDVTMFWGCGLGRSKVRATFRVGEPFVSGFASGTLMVLQCFLVPDSKFLPETWVYVSRRQCIG